MTLKFVRGNLKLGALLLFSASLACASTVTYSADIFSPPGTEHDPSVVPSFFPVTLSLPKFDSSLGVLTGVSITVDWTETATISVTNSDPLADHAFTGATISVPLTVNAPGLTFGVLATAGPVSSAGSTPTSSTGGVITAGMMVPKSFSVFLPSPSPCALGCPVFGQNNYVGIQGAGSEQSVLNDSSLWAPYIGTGSQFFDVSVGSGSFSYTGTGVGTSALFFGGKAEVGGKVSITYSYTLDGGADTPEPMTMMLVGSAIVTLGIVMRRRRVRV